MNVYLNELSLTDGAGGDSLALVENLIEQSEKLTADYGLIRIKAPADYKGLIIAGDRSFSQLIQPGNGIPFNQQLRIIGFMANRVSIIHGEIDTAVGQEIENKSAWSSVQLNGTASYTLTGAYLLKRPAISMANEDHAVDDLSCNFRLEYDKSEKDKPITIKNIHDQNSITVHHQYLIDCKREEAFKPHRWKPEELPIWNKRTFEVLAELDFPKILEGKDNVINDLQTTGRLIASLNSWRHDERLSSINTNEHRIRDIFVSVGGRGTWYLSTDVKNYKGTFELCDSEGRHEGQISFTTGKFIPRAANNPKGQYEDGTHNIKLRR